MFLVRFFGFLDILAAIMLILSLFDTGPLRLYIGSGLYLLLKGYMFRGDLFSTIDLVIGSFFFIFLLFSWNFFIILFTVYLFLKGFYSMVWI